MRTARKADRALRRRTAVAALTAVCVAIAEPSWANAPVITVLAPPSLAGLVTKVGAYLDVSIERLDPERELSTRAGSAIEAEKRTEDALTRELATARAAYQELRFREALAALERAQVLSSALGAGQVARWREIALNRMLNHLALNEPAGAVEALGLALNLGYEGPSPGDLSPETTAFVAQQRREREETRLGWLRVRLDPPDAALSWDGDDQRAGDASAGAASERELTAGTHLIAARRLGFVPRAQLVNISPGAREQLVFSLTSAPPALLAQQLLTHLRARRPLHDHPELVARVWGTGRALIERSAETPGSAARRDVVLLWFGSAAQPAPERDARGLPLVERRTCPAEPAAAACLANHLQQLSGLRPAPMAVRSRPAKPFYRRWWFWGIVGGTVAAAATATGVYFGTRPSSGVALDATLR